METENMVFSTLAIPPGELLEEEIDARGISKSELALRLGRPMSFVDALFKGGEPISSDVASRLEQIVDVPAEIWLNLETKYRLTLERNRERKKSAFLKQA